MSSARRGRLLVVGQHDQATGLARVVRGICGAVSGAWEVHVLGIDVPTLPASHPWIVHRVPDPHDVYGAAEVPRLVDRIRPDIVLMVHDMLIVRLLVHRLKGARFRPRTMAYVPVDGPIRSPQALEPLIALDSLVVYTQFARRLVQKAARSWQAPSGTCLDRPHVISHGVDTAHFFPAAEPTPDPGPGTGTDAPFVVLNANRNQPRKRVDLTVAGFATFARGKPPTVTLHLHMDLGGHGCDVRREARRLGIEERLRVTQDAPGHPVVSDEELNALYNRCTVGLNTASGEGWGLVALEHAATGAAQIVPDHTAGRELWSGAAEMLAPPERWESRHPRYGPPVHPSTVAAALERLYSDPEHRSRLAEAGRRRATSPEYSWSHVGECWDAHLQQVRESAPSSVTT